VNWRGKTVVSLFGPIRLQRPYYHCKHCRRSDPTWDRILGLSEESLTPAAAELSALAGTLTGFAEAAEKTLVRMSGLRICESTVQRTTEGAGSRLAELIRQEVAFTEPRSWDWHRDRHGRTCAYVSLDATGVRRQAPDGRRAEGRMAQVGMIYNPCPRGDGEGVDQRRYLAGFYDDVTQLGRQLHVEALQVGWHEAEIHLALTDGAHVLEKLVRTYFPRATLILDFWHAVEHLAELARALHPQEDAMQRQLDAWAHTLKHQGGPSLLAQLEAIDIERSSPEVRETFRKETNYLRNNLHRTDYPTYLQNGWQIGSGPIEAACKTVVGQRLKQAGMRWRDFGADAVCHLRAVYLSDPDLWISFWDARRHLQN
jgi:hypothetical protein